MNVTNIEKEYMTQEQADKYNKVTNRDYHCNEGDFYRYKINIEDDNGHDFLVYFNHIGAASSPYIQTFKPDNVPHWDRLELFDEVKITALEAVSNDKDNEVMSKYASDVLMWIRTLQRCTQDAIDKGNDSFSIGDNEFTLNFKKVEHPSSIYDYECLSPEHSIAGEQYFEGLVRCACVIVDEDKLEEEKEYDKQACYKFYKERIEGQSIKTSDTYAEDCDFYSDWHKDIFGFRPRGDFGEYISPYSLDDIELDDVERE